MMALIDRNLLECNLRRNPCYRYIVGDCLFDSISYLLHYEISSTLLRMNTMNHLAYCLSLNTPKAQETRRLELNVEWMHDLHSGVYNEHQYIQKMSISATQGGLWGDFTAIKWISDYLQKPLYVWCTTSGRIIYRTGDEFHSEALHLAFGSSHYEPIEKINQSIPVILPTENTSIDNKRFEIINLETNSLNHNDLSETQVTFDEQMFQKSLLAKDMHHNMLPNIIRKKKRMFWSLELNDSLESLILDSSTNSEIASKFLLQRKELNLSIAQVITHIQKLKSGKIKTINKRNEDKNEYTLPEETIPFAEMKNDNKPICTNKKRAYMKWNEMDESLKLILNEHKSSTNLIKANLFVEKHPEFKKTATQVVKRIKLISSKLKKSTLSNENSSNYNKIENVTSKKKNHSLNNPFTKYLEKLKDVPIYPCICCERLNFLSKSTLIDQKNIDKINNVLSDFKLLKEEIKYICNFCFSLIKKGTIPTYCVPQKISRNYVIESVNLLTILEERLISPRLAFAQIHKLHNYGQFKLHGSIINVPANINQTQSILPRLPEDGTTIGILLKRRLEYRSPYMSGNIRPNIIMMALKDLIKTPLYKECNVHIRPQWKSLFALHMQSSSNLDINFDLEANNFEEDLEDLPSETLIHNFLESEKIHDFNNTMSVAPSQEYSPIGIFKDKHSEELNYPTLFYGHPRDNNVTNNFSYHQIASWEVLHKNHDFATNIQNIFFKAIKICIEKVKNSSWIRIRKGKLSGRKLTAGQVVEEPNLDKILESHIGFRDLQKLRTSPDYVEGLRKNLFAMIRQLGPPTFFITLTSAERLWSPLIEALYKLNSTRLNLPNLNCLESIHIAELIRSDPVTCALYYNHRTKSFRELLQKESSILGEVIDFFFITEFQHRGSEHEHALIWIKDAPLFQLNSSKEIEEFADKYITTNKTLLPESLQEAQTHKHSRTCRKKGQSTCRFHYPLPPMKHTMILEPLKDIEAFKLSDLKYKAKEIFAYLKDLDTDIKMDFDEFLKIIRLTEETYILALRSQLKRPQIFLKRTLNNIRTNTFNINIAHTWYANTDIQFILDPYAAATYCTSYMTKIDKSITTELKSILQKCIVDKTDANLRILKLGNAFLNAQQMSAQLAIYLILSIPLYHCSRSFSFINTSPSQDRAFVLKPQQQLKRMDKESTDVMCKSIIDKYLDRPNNLQDICLAEFVAKYNHTKTKISIRNKFKVIRFVHYNRFKDLENWSREQLLLYVPFIGSEECLKNDKNTWKEAYEEQIEIISEKWRVFNYQIQKTSENDCRDEWINLQDYATNLELFRDSSIWNDSTIDDIESIPISTNNEKYDLATDIFVKPHSTTTYKNRLQDNNNILDVMKDDDYFKIMRSLNEEQRAIYDDIMYKKRVHSNDSIYLFLTGGAGTGKTFTLHAIIQGLLRIHNKDLQSDPLKAKALLMAFTGKAAFNIGGTTIHSALHIPINQSFSNVGKLSSELLNKLTDQYDQLKFIVLDEISLVGSRMLDAIDQRLRSIKHVQNKFFGGLDVIVTGDFYQAPPVRDRWVFQRLNFGLNTIAPNFWHEHIKCYELNTVMRQSDTMFINILNRFRKALHTTEDIDTMNNLCLKQPSEISVIPFLFYTNKDTTTHNNNVFMRAIGPTFHFEAIDIRHRSLPSSYEIPNDPSKTAGLHTNIKVKKDMLVELCNNYAISDGLVNGADGLFKTTSCFNDKSYIWIEFFNTNVGIATRFSNSYLYKNLDVESTWTPIEPVSKEIRIGKNQTHLLTRIQFPIQLAAARTIHRSQGLSLDDVAFNPTGVNKHGLAYTALSRIRTKEKLYLLAPLSTSNFQVDKSVIQEMDRLTTFGKWIFSVPMLKTMRHSHVIIQSININSLRKNYLDYKSDHNMQSSHILCFQETKINSENDIKNYIDTSRYKFIYAYEKHGLLMLYENQMICASFQTQVYDGSEYIAASFNLGTRNAIYIVTVYRCHSTHITIFLKNLHNLINDAPIECPIIILGDFNIDMSNDTMQHYEIEKILKYMNKQQLIQRISTPTTQKNSLIDHIWSNIPGIETKYGVTDAYWPDYHKPIYCAFKLPNILPKYKRQSHSFCFT